MIYVYAWLVALLLVLIYVLGVQMGKRYALRIFQEDMRVAREVIDTCAAMANDGRYAQLHAFLVEVSDTAMDGFCVGKLVEGLSNRRVSETKALNPVERDQQPDT